MHSWTSSDLISLDQIISSAAKMLDKRSIDMESLVRGPTIPVLRPCDVFEPSVYQWILLSLNTRSNCVLPRVTLNFLVKFIQFLISRLGIRAGEPCSPIAWLFWNEITLPLPYPFAFMCSIVCFAIWLSSTWSGLPTLRRCKPVCSFDGWGPTEISEAFKAHATAPYVIIGLTNMVYLHLVILGLQVQDFPARRLEIMRAFVALAKVNPTCLFRRTVETCVRISYLPSFDIALPPRLVVFKPGRDLLLVKGRMVVFDELIFTQTLLHHPFAKSNPFEHCRRVFSNLLFVNKTISSM